MNFQQAIVRQPSLSITNGLTTSAHLGTVDYQKALGQHELYVETLNACGLKVTVLEALEDFPDACFVEDPALITAEFALYTRPGAPSRMDEVAYFLLKLPN